MSGLDVAAEAGPTTRDLVAADPQREELLAHDELVSVFRLHYVGLCRLAYLIVGDTSLAEDVVQEAFLRTFAGWRRLREPARLQVYLRRAVINASRSKLRRRGVEARANALFHAAERPSARSSDDSDTTLAVMDAVRRLPPRQRAAVLLRYYLDLPEAEIADTLGTRVGTVKSQLAKARRNLGRTGLGATDG